MRAICPHSANNWPSVATAVLLPTTDVQSCGRVYLSCLDGKKTLQNIVTKWSIFYFNLILPKAFQLFNFALRKEEAKLVLEKKNHCLTESAHRWPDSISLCFLSLALNRYLYSCIVYKKKKKCKVRSDIFTALSTMVLCLFFIQGEGYDQVADKRGFDAVEGHSRWSTVRVNHAASWNRTPWYYPGSSRRL